MKNRKLKPVLMVVSASLLFSIGAPVSKLTASPPLVLTFFRCLAGLAAFTLYGVLNGELRLFVPRPRLILGGILYAGTSLGFYTALTLTTAANSTVLGNTSPFFLAVLGFVFLGEKPQKRDWFILGFIMAGIILCFYGGFSLAGSAGDLIALICGFMFSVLVVIMKKAGPRDALQPVIWGNLFAVIISAPALFHPGTVVIREIPLFLMLGFLQMAAPFLLYARAQETLSTMEASMFKLLEPVAAPLWVGMLAGEIPSVYSITGGLIVVSTLFFKTALEYRDMNKPLQPAGAEVAAGCADRLR